MTLFELDIRTIMRLLLIGNLMVIVMVAAYQKEGNLPLRLFLLGKIAHLLTWALFIFRDDISPLLSVGLANLLLLIGFSLEMAAISRLSGRRHKLEWFSGAVVVAATALLGIFFWLVPNPSLRVAIASIATLAIYAPTSVLLIRMPKASRLQKLIGSLFLAFCGILALRAATALTDHTNLFSVGAVQSLTFVSLFGFMLTSGVGFLLLMKEELDRDLLVAASIDSLTGAFNRRAFVANAEIAIGIAIRSKMPMTMLMIDIDHFKRVNDTWGHAGGDLVLQAFAANVRRQVRPHDVFGRLGGEEFAVLLFNTGDAALDVAERIRKSVENETIGPAPGIRYTVSIGCDTLIPDAVESLTGMLKRSDAALYRAKENGRNMISR